MSGEGVEASVEFAALRAGLIGGAAVDPPEGLLAARFTRDEVALLSLVQINGAAAHVKRELAGPRGDGRHQRTLGVAIRPVDGSSQSGDARGQIQPGLRHVLAKRSPRADFRD